MRLKRVLKKGQEPIVRSTLRAIWLLVIDPFFKPKALRILLTQEFCNLRVDMVIVNFCRHLQRITDRTVIT